MRTGRAWRRATLLVPLLTLATWAVALPAPAAAAGSTFTVTTNGDNPDVAPGDGICDVTASPSTTRCTLRAAIMEANADPDASTIAFAITTGSGATKTITPQSKLPAITAPLVIDGYTQPGATPNTASPGTNAVLRVALDGRFITDAGLTAEAPVTIKGLAIFWFGRGIQLSTGSDGSRILGNFIGTDATGTIDRGNDTSGILVNSSDVHIGSIVRADRNLVSGNTASGINIGIAASGVIIQGNLVGTGKNAKTALPNDANGVFISGSSGHLVGGTFTGQGNVIAFNGQDGVRLISLTVGATTLVPSGVRISSNSMFKNAQEGIDLGGDGPTANDPVPDPDKGPNGLQNFPKLSSAAGVADGTVVAGTLATRKNASMEIQLFSSPTSDAEGKTLLATFTVDSGATGKVAFTHTVGVLAPGVRVTATATDASKANTSEFSPAVVVTP
ncbi:MAG: right-handed parallel beta-helix repeat-containing protein [Chloroflexota bacterium]